jgi:hypothetical protein
MTWGELGTLASILGAFIGASAVVQAWLGSRTVKAMHAETQQTLSRMEAGTQQTLARMDATSQETLRTLGEGQKSLGEAVQGIGAGQARLGEILARMDQAAEQRYRDLRDRLDGEEGPRA